METDGAFEQRHLAVATDFIGKCPKVAFSRYKKKTVNAAFIDDNILHLEFQIEFFVFLLIPVDRWRIPKNPKNPKNSENGSRDQRLCGNVANVNSVNNC